MHFVDASLAFSQHFAPEILTAVLGLLSIVLIDRGSARYGDLEAGLTPKKHRAIAIDASSQIALGSLGMAVTAFTAGNPLFAYPEAVAVVASFEPYFENCFPGLGRFYKAIRIKALVKIAALLVGGYTIVMYAHTPLQVLPPLGLTLLSLAFSGMPPTFYRTFTLTGGSALVIGSVANGIVALQAGNATGVIMSLAFFALNVMFTYAEWKDTEKIGGLKKILLKDWQIIEHDVEAALGK